MLSTYSTINLALKQALPKLSKQPNSFLPNELWLHIFTEADSESLLHLRLASRNVSQLANLVLAQRLLLPMKTLHQKSLTLNTMLQHLHATKTPHLTHYRAFLRQTAPADINEVIWVLLSNTVPLTPF
jgi:hypothetical protein